MASVTAQVQLWQQLEGQLLKLSKEKTFSDPAVREVRKQLRAAAESVLLKNINVAEDKGLEVKLWHQCFHKPVQEFRRRIVEAKTRGEKGREMLAKLTKAFSNLLLDAISFYKALAAKLQIVYGDVGFKLSTRDLGAFAQQLVGLEPAADKPDIRLSVYRCLVCLGDLTRYHIQLDLEPKRDWQKADAFYCLGIKIYPQAGNAYNQRAVLAGYEGRDLEAVYNYVRSLSVKAPFTIAKENLNQLLEQVRLRQAKLPMPSGRAPSRSLHGWKLPDILRTVETRFLHLQGLLFTKINFDTFQVVIRAALSDLDDLLSRDAVVKGPIGHGRHRSDQVILQLAALCIFHQYNLPKPDDLSPTELAKRADLQRAARDLVFVFTGRLAKAAAMASAGMELGISACPILPTISVLLQWLATHPAELTAVEETAGSRSLLLKALAELTLAAAASTEKVKAVAGKEAAAELSALPEDVELRAYGPLLEAQEKLDFENPSSPQAAAVVRLQRVISQLQKVAEGLKSANLSETAGCAAACKAVTGFLGKVGDNLDQGESPSHADNLEQGKSPSPANKSPPMAAAPRAEDDNEELIMFQPLGGSVSAAAPAASKHAEAESNGRDPAGSEEGQIPRLRSNPPQVQTEEMEEAGSLESEKGHREEQLAESGLPTSREMLPRSSSPLRMREDEQQKLAIEAEHGRTAVDMEIVLPEVQAINRNPSGHVTGAESQHTADIIPAAPKPAVDVPAWDPFGGVMNRALTPMDRQVPGSHTDVQLLGNFNGRSASHVSMQQLSQEPSRGSTRVGTPVPAAPSSLTPPPGFSQPGAFGGAWPLSRLGAAPEAPAPTGLLDAHMLGQLSGSTHLPGGLVAAQQTNLWNGVGNSMSGSLDAQFRFQQAGNPLTNFGGLPGSGALQNQPPENYAGFFPQSPPPSLLPTHLLGADLAAQLMPLADSNLAAFGSAGPGFAAGQLPGFSQTTNGSLGQDIWQGLGFSPAALPPQQQQLPAHSLAWLAGNSSSAFGAQLQQNQFQQFQGQPMSQQGTDFQSLQRLLAARSQPANFDPAASDPLSRWAASQPALQNPSTATAGSEPRGASGLPGSSDQQWANSNLLKALQEGSGRAAAGEQAPGASLVNSLAASRPDDSYQQQQLLGGIHQHLSGTRAGQDAHRSSQQATGPAGTGGDMSWLDAFEAEQRRLAPSNPGGGQPIG